MTEFLIPPVLASTEPLPETDRRRFESQACALFAQERLCTWFVQQQLPGSAGVWMFLDPNGKQPPATICYLRYLRERGLLRYHPTMAHWVQLAYWVCGAEPQPFSAEQLAVAPVTVVQ